MRPHSGGGMDKLTLYSDSLYISPYGFSVYVALREKELPFAYVPVSLSDREHDAPRFQEHGMSGKVPQLEHGEFRLAESSAIIEYLEESFPAPIHRGVLPKGVQERARARQIMSWIRSDLGPLRTERPTTTIFYERAREP